MIKIGKVIKPLEFDIAGEVFEVNKTDDVLMKLDKRVRALSSEAAELLDLSDTSERFARLRTTLIENYDELLGEGAFHKIEKAISDDAGEYTLVMSRMFFEITDHLNEKANEVES